MAESTVTAKGQTTIPKSIRDHLQLRPGAKVKFFVGHDGRVTILPVLPAVELRRPSPYSGPTVTIEEMDEAIAAAVAEKHAKVGRD